MRRDRTMLQGGLCSLLWMCSLCLISVLLAGCGDSGTAPASTAPAATTVESAPASAPNAVQALADASIATTAITVPVTAGRSGEAIVEQYCAVCHSRGLYNAPKIGDAAAWQTKLAEGREHLWQVVLNGEKAMPPRGNCHDCSDTELRAAMDYLLAAAQPADAKPVENSPP